MMGPNEFSDSREGDELQTIWSIPGPWSLHPIEQGINNLTQVIDTPLGPFILRTYDADRHLEHIGYELSLLRELGQTDLPFRIPGPLPTITGELFAIYSGKIITLSTKLPGVSPDNNNLQQARAAGGALAELGKALADIQIEATFEAVPFPPSGDLEAWGRISLDSVNSIISQLPVTKEEQDEIFGLVERTQAATSSLYRNLPLQIIHRDFDQSNVLMEGNSVTGVLDFEFCGHDLRILDLAYALSQWPSGWWNTGQEWQIIDAFGQGYLQHQRLPEEELEMLPLVFRLRMVASLFFRFGRYARNLEALESLLEHVQDALRFQRWLHLHEEQLLRHLRGWSS